VSLFALPRDLSPAITVLHMFLSSPKPTLRYAAVRTLSKVAMAHPLAVAKCNDDMEALVSDGNRTIATLAITVRDCCCYHSMIMMIMMMMMAIRP
jgi:hypothetical protein